MALELVRYTDLYESKWDNMVLNHSINGTFLQTRNFLNYHPPGRFQDVSIAVLQGSSLVAVIPACDTEEEGKRCFFSHKGSTFGGVVIHEGKYTVSFLEDLLLSFDEYLIRSGYEKVMLKCTSQLFSKRPVDLLDYYLFKSGYNQYDELSFYIDLKKAPEDLLSLLSSSRRRDYRYSLKNGLSFRRLETDGEIEQFHRILVKNLEKFQAKPVHTVQELVEFKRKRLVNETDFFGVFFEDRLVAGTMLFYFGKEVMHTQYLAQDPDYSHLFLMNFLDFNLISMAREIGFHTFSFGISTEERGRVLNKGLALFKEGFGCDFCVNRTYYKEL